MDTTYLTGAPGRRSSAEPSDGRHTVHGMEEPHDVLVTRAAYDTVAVDHAELVRTALAGMPLDRAMLGVFAERVRAAGGGTVADLGPGSGRVT